MLWEALGVVIRWALLDLTCKVRIQLPEELVSGDVQTANKNVVRKKRSGPGNTLIRGKEMFHVRYFFVFRPHVLHFEPHARGWHEQLLRSEETRCQEDYKPVNLLV